MCADISELCERQLRSWRKLRSTDSTRASRRRPRVWAPSPSSGPWNHPKLCRQVKYTFGFRGGPSILHSKRGMFLYESQIQTRNRQLVKCFIIRLAFGLLQPITSFLYCGKAMVQILQIRHYGNVCELVCKIDREV